MKNHVASASRFALLAVAVAMTFRAARSRVTITPFAMTSQD